MKKVLCMISSPPESANAKRGLALAEEWIKQGHSVKICLIQDGIYAALVKANPVDGLESVQWFALTDDLRLRGFQNEDLRSGAQSIDYAHLVQMIMGDVDQVVGSF